MSIVEFSLRRRVTVAMAALALVLFGLVAFSRLNVGLLPNLSYPSLTVETKLPGAAPSEVEQLVTRPIEERVGVVAGARRLTSVSRPGVSQVTVEFDWGRDMDFAAIDVREKLERLLLPQTADPPTLLRFDPAAEPVLRLYLTGSDDLEALRRVAEDVVERELESTEGVAALELSGGFEREIEIEIDEDLVAASGLAIADVTAKLAETNVDQAGGSLYEREARYLVRTRNRFESLDDVRQTVVVDRTGRRVTVDDVADVRWAHAERDTVTRLGGQEAVELAVYKEGDANTTAVAKAVHQRLGELRGRLPGGLELVVAADQSTFIVASVDEVLNAAGLGGVFAVVVLLLFLRDVRSTMIIAACIPISIIATFFLMYQAGTTLNVMSLGGLALGVGMLVDNAIVVLEAIHRRREAGDDSATAARRGAGEVGKAVIASTLTTVAVFVPIVFLEGIASQLFGDMALTVCFSLLVSLAVSLTLIPMLAASRASSSGEPGRATRVAAAPIRVLRRGLAFVGSSIAMVLRPIGWTFDRGLGAVVSAYPAVLRASVRRPLTVVGIAVLTFGAAVASVPRLGLDLVPSLSQTEIAFAVELPAGASLPNTDRVLQTIPAALEHDPRVEQVATVAGRGAATGTGVGARGEHFGFVQIRLRDDATAQDAEAVVELVSERLHHAGSARHRVVDSTVLSLHRPIEVELYGDDLAQLRDAGETIRGRLASIEGIEEPRSSAELGNPEVRVRFHRDRILARGLTLAGVAEAVRTKLQGDVATKYRQNDRDIDVRVRAEGSGEASLPRVRELIVGRAGEVAVRLSDVADVELGYGPGEIHRVGQNRAAIVSADLRGRDMGTVSEEIEAVLDELVLPVGVTAEVAGQQTEMVRSINSLFFAMGLAAFLIYIVMASQFESLRQPFVIIFTLPLAAVGVIWALLLTDTSVSVISAIGMVMLAGIVVNNAIVLVDAINRRRSAGESVAAAVEGGGRERLRPILMTSLTTILGLMPMALSIGAGAELRRSLAIAVVGGLAAATALTLVVIPTIYALVVRRRPTEAS